MANIELNSIREHMDVIAAGGQHIGKVDHLQDGKIKLTKTDSPDGQHHLVPLSWVERVDEHVHLSKTLSDIKGMTGGGSSGAHSDAVPEAGKRDAVP